MLLNMKQSTILMLIVVSEIFHVMAMQVTLFGPKNVRPKKLYVSSHCQKIPKEISSNLRFVNTGNTCVLLWEDDSCQTNSLSIVTKDSETMPGILEN